MNPLGKEGGPKFDDSATLETGMTPLKKAVVALFLLSAVCLIAPFSDLSAQTVLIRAEKIYTVSGGIVEDGNILIEDGKIARVGRDFPVPAGAQEIRAHLKEVLESHGLASNSLKCLASIDVKNDEAGLIAVSESIDKPLVFFTREELNQVKGIKNPSSVVEKHVGVKSVCEAAAILASRDGTLIVPKQSTRKVTVAIARINFLSSE